jgi:hypothetical protein
MMDKMLVEGLHTILYCPFEHDLIALLNDESEMKRLSLEGVNYIEKHHNTKNIVEQIYKYYG